MELAGGVLACLGEKNHPWGVEELVVASRPPLPLQVAREHAGSRAACTLRAGPATHDCPIPPVTFPPPLPVLMSFCCCSRPLPPTLCLPGSSSQAGQHSAK